MCAQRVTRHVLVVDDYPDVAEMLAMLLVDASPMNLTAEFGTDGAEAIRLAIAHQPQVVLLDIDMPVMDGVDAALAIRAGMPGKAPLLIAMTGNPGQAAAMRTHLAFDRILTKPVDLEILLDLLCEKVSASIIGPGRTPANPQEAERCRIDGIRRPIAPVSCRHRVRP